MMHAAYVNANLSGIGRSRDSLRDSLVASSHLRTAMKLSSGTEALKADRQGVGTRQACFGEATQIQAFAQSRSYCVFL